MCSNNRVRWDNLKTGGTGQAALPVDRADTLDGSVRAVPPLPLALSGGLLDRATRRTFDTPEFAGMVFHEIEAKSIINRVPAQSQVPFSWTVNPYRGCSHACVYCLAGETPILMADGRTKQLADVRVGDRIYGTEVRGRFRRFVPTTVLAHWRTEKPAYRIRLDDGTSLVASADHRFLANRGWKHVSDLTIGTKLIGTGQFAAPPKLNEDYRVGYLCGMVRGDANLNPHRPIRGVRRFRLALADPDALARAGEFLDAFDIATTRFQLAPATGVRMPMWAIATSDEAGMRTISELITWPADPSPDWQRGFLAGIFDAEGSRTRGVLRIFSNDVEVIDHIVAACAHFGFAIAHDVPRANGVRTIQIVGGLREHLRFYHLTGPAIARKWDIDGAAVRSNQPPRVVEIASLGIDMPMFDITTGTGDFIADGIVSHNCFARSTHEYLEFDSGRDFDTQVVVKVNAGALLRRELAAPRWRGASIALGTNVDVYQRAEGRYRLMPEIIAALRDFANPFSILTKGTLILRDLDLLRAAAEVTDVGIAFSVGFVDEELWRLVEPGTPSPSRRLDAVRRFADAGFDVTVLMAPILPGLTDGDESIDATVRAIAAAGATGVTPLPLHLRSGAREWYMAFLERNRPSLRAHYLRLFRSNAYLAAAEQREITARVRIAARRYGLSMSGAREARTVPPPAPAKPEPEQLTLL
jgi:DNA repair photolyase